MITMATVEAASDPVEGDRVTLKGGTMQGVIERIVNSTAGGGFSNGGLPMARVRWDSGSTSRETLKKLVKATAKQASSTVDAQEEGDEHVYQAIIKDRLGSLRRD